MKPNLYLARSAMAGALGGLLFGFDTAVIAVATYSLTGTFDLTPSQLGLTVSIALWGSVLGALTSGLLGEKVGGRRALMIMAALYLVSAIGCAAAWNWPSLLTLRFIGGLGIGGSSVLGPVYIAEIARPTGGAAWWALSKSTWSSAFCSHTYRIFALRCFTLGILSGAGSSAFRQRRHCFFSCSSWAFRRAHAGSLRKTACLRLAKSCGSSDRTTPKLNYGRSLPPFSSIVLNRASLFFRVSTRFRYS